MQRKLFGLLALVAAVLILAPMAESQPPGDKKGKGPPFKLGQVFPPPLLAELNLTPEQEKELEAITKDLKAKLDKLLTAEQKKTIENFRPRGPGSGDKGGKGDKAKGKGGPGGKGGKDDARPDRPPLETPPIEKGGKSGPGGKDGKEVSRNDPSIQWFATLSRGLA